MGVSVVVPNFNDASRLQRALRALLRQQPPPDEIIVVDDASTDDSVGVIERFQREHTSIRLIRHGSNRGAAAALNTGLSAATGDLIYFAASDDFVLGGFFAEAAATLNQFPNAAYFCAQVVLVDEKGAIRDFRPLLPPSSDVAFISPFDARRMIHTIDNWAIGQSVVLRRQALLDINGFDESLGSFCDGINYRLLAFRHGFCFSPQTVAAWEVRADTLSARSALSPVESVRLIAAAKRWMAERCPPPLDTEYPELLGRRLSFNFARMAIMTPGDNLDTIDKLPGLSGLDRRVVALIGNKTRLSHIVAQFWLTLRLRPFGLASLVRAFVRKAMSRQRNLQDATRLLSA